MSGRKYDPPTITTVGNLNDVLASTCCPPDLRGAFAGMDRGLPGGDSWVLEIGLGAARISVAPMTGRAAPYRLVVFLDGRIRFDSRGVATAERAMEDASSFLDSVGFPHPRTVLVDIGRDLDSWPDTVQDALGQAYRAALAPEADPEGGK